MRVVYRVADRRIVSTTGLSLIGDPEPGTEIERNVIPNIGGSSSDYEEITVSDTKAREMYASASYELSAVLQGTDDDVICYPHLNVTAAPSPAAVDQIVTVTARVPAKSPDTEATFVVVGGVPIMVPVQGGAASHAFVFAGLGTYLVSVSSAHHGVATVEVVVQ